MSIDSAQLAKYVSLVRISDMGMGRGQGDERKIVFYTLPGRNKPKTDLKNKKAKIFPFCSIITTIPRNLAKRKIVSFFLYNFKNFDEEWVARMLAMMEIVAFFFCF